MNKKRLAIIGAGNISDFHVPAMKKAGFKIVCCCASLKSKRALNFAKKHKIPKVYDSYKDLITNENEWDALLIAISVEPTAKILSEFLKFKRPILVEKPVSTNSSVIKEIKKYSNFVQVAYNRRFYSTVSYAKKFLSENSNSLIKMFLPDSIDFRLSKDKQNYFSVKENSVHGLDILNYLVPELELYYVEEYLQPNNSFGRIAFLRSPNHQKCLVFFNWNAPSNFSIEINSLPYKLELKPFEKFTLFEGMQIIEPSIDYPVRQYVPKVIDSGSVFDNVRDQKPGFLEQSLEFMNLVSGNSCKIAANLEDAFKVTKLAEKILDYKL